MAVRMNTEPLPRRKKVGFGLLLAAAVLLLVEIGGHAVFLVAYHGTPLWEHRRPSYRFTPHGLSELLPNALARLPGYPNHLHTGRHGFIHNGEDEPLTGETFNVFLLGGSTVEGRGASGNDRTTAAVLEERLNVDSGGARRRIRVINAGVSGHVSYQQLCLLSGKILPSLPVDFVIALDGRNDAFFALAYADHGWRPNWCPDADLLTAQVNDVLFQGTSVTVPLSRKLLRYSMTCALVDKALQAAASAGPDFPQAEMPSEAFLERAVDAYVANHVVARTRCALLEKPYVVFLQPTLLPRLKRNRTPLERERLRAVAARFANPEVYVPAMTRFYDLAARRADEHVWFRDASDLLADVEHEMYADSCHYNDAGHRRIAEALAAALGPRIRKLAVHAKP